MAKFFSENKSQFIGFRQLPNYPLTSLKVMVGGIDFHNGEYETNDEILIACLRKFISANIKYCPIWEEGSKPLATALEPVEVINNDDVFEEFKRLLRL